MSRLGFLRTRTLGQPYFLGSCSFSLAVIFGVFASIDVLNDSDSCVSSSKLTTHRVSIINQRWYIPTWKNRFLWHLCLRQRSWETAVKSISNEESRITRRSDLCKESRQQRIRDVVGVLHPTCRKNHGGNLCINLKLSGRQRACARKSDGGSGPHERRPHKVPGLRGKKASALLVTWTSFWKSVPQRVVTWLAERVPERRKPENCCSWVSCILQRWLHRGQNVGLAVTEEVVKLDGKDGITVSVSAHTSLKTCISIKSSFFVFMIARRCKIYVGS